MKLSGIRRITGFVTLVCGALVLFFASRDPVRLTSAIPGVSGMGLNTALCFVLSGIALILPTKASFRVLRRGLAVACLLIAGFAVAQFLAKWAPSDGWWRYLLNVRRDGGGLSDWPGRMALATAIAFIALNLALLTFEGSRLGSRVALHMMGVVILAAIALIGLFSGGLGVLVFYNLTPDVALMSVPTAAGLFLLAVSGGALLAESPSLALYFQGRADRQAFAVSAGVLTVAVIVAGLSGWAVVVGHSVHTLQGTFIKILRTNAQVLREDLATAARLAGENPELAQLGRLISEPGERGDALSLQSAVEQVVQAGAARDIVSLSVVDRGGHRLAFFGREEGSLIQKLPLTLEFPAWLGWNQSGWWLETRIPLFEEGRVVAEAVVQTRLERVNAMFAETARLGNTWQVQLCAANAGAVSCVAPRLPAATRRFRLSGPSKWEGFLSGAVLGQAEAVTVDDDRGVPVVAAYEPVGAPHVGMLQRVDVAELYGPLSQRVWGMLAAMVPLIGAGAFVSYRRVKPLVADLDKAQVYFRAILAGVPSGVLVSNDKGQVETYNPAALSILGTEPTDARDAGVAALLASSPGTTPHEIELTRRDGRAIVLEVYRQTIRIGAVRRCLTTFRDVTDRRRAEAELRRSEASLANAQRIAHLGSWDWDIVTNDLSWSDEIYRIFGLQPHQFDATYDAFLATVHPDDREAVREASARALRGAGPYRVEHRIVLPDGAEKVVQEQGETTFDSSGRPIRMTGTVLDITEQKRAEELIFRREQEFRALAEHSPDIISRYDRSLRRLYVNPAIESETGHPPSWYLGKTYGELGLPEHFVSQWETALRRVFDTGREEQFEFSYEMDGRKGYYHARVVPEFAIDGTVGTVLSVVRNVMALKAAEQALRENQARLQGITAHVPGMVFQCVMKAGTDALSFTYVSEGATLVWGLSAAHIRRNPGIIEQTILPEDLAGYRDAMATSRRALQAWNWEGRIASPGGAVKWLNLRASPRSSETGDVFWEGVVFNITDSKQKERELAQSRQQLRELAAHHETVREEDRKRIAREIHDELGQVLTALKMDLSLLELGAEQGVDVKTHTQGMKQLVDRTIRIVRNIAADLRPAVLDVGLVSAIEWLAEEFEKRSGVTCRLDVQGGDVALDEEVQTSVFRIVQESLTNIARHAQAQHVDILLGVRDGMLHVDINDDGKGFDVEASRTSKSFGLLGMQERALTLNGEIRIISVPGRGTMVSLVVPMGREAAS